MSRDIISNHVEFSKEVLNEAVMENGKLIFTKCRDKDCAILLRGNRLKAVSVLSDENQRIGAIYIAKVRKVVKNLDACFVEIAGGEVCFLPLREAVKVFRCNVVQGRKNTALCQGDEILVQIIREAQKNKQATVTAHISLTNESAVIGIGSNKIGYSSKLTKEQKKHYKTMLTDEGYVKNGVFMAPKKLTPQIKPYIHEVLSESGMVVRTLAVEKSDEEFLRAVEELFIEFTDILATARHRICYTCIKQPKPPFAAVIDRLVYDYEYDEIVTDDEELYKRMTEYADSYISGKNIRLYNDDMLTLSKLYSLDTKIGEALEKRVWLKSGAYIVIDCTEAMTVIDVNSGKSEASGRADANNYFDVNAEAAREIALQLRLRNISGIIIVDFINMDSENDNLELMKILDRAVSADKQKCVVVDMTKLGLVEITRRKDYKPLSEQF